MTKQKILIDCDPGHDDLVAILFAARHLDLVGVTTVHGNNTLANTTRNGLIALELGNIDVPLAAGCSEPMAQASIGIGEGHGRTGLDGAEVDEPKRKPIDMHGVDFIIETAARHRGELVLAPVGPLTNVAMALKREPRLRQWLREISLMGGSTTTGNYTPAAEFNIAADVEAAWTVFESGVPLRMAGLNITRVTGFGEADIARMRACGRRAAAVVADLMAFYLDTQRKRYGLDVATMHDVCAVVPFVHPSFITYLHTSARIEKGEGLTRGMTMCDLRHPQGSKDGHLKHSTPPNCEVAIGVDSRRLIDSVLETIMTYD